MPIVASYTISDGNEGVVEQTATVVVTGVNDAPVYTLEVTAQLADGAEDTAYTLNADDLLAGYADADGDALSVSDLVISNGTVVDNENGTYTFTPEADFNGPVSVSYNVVDGNGGSVAASRTFDVVAVNDAPTGTATAELVNGTEDVPYTLNAANLLVGFSDVDGDTLSVTNVSVNQGFVVDHADGTFTVNPVVNYNGEVIVSYTVTDGTEGILAQNSFTLDAVNDAPVITSDEGAESVTKTVNENTTSVATITAEDVDSASLVYQLLGADADKFAIDTNGNLSFVNAPNFEAPQDAGADNQYDVTVQIFDGTSADTQAISVNVANVADEVTDIRFSPDDAAFTNGSVLAGNQLGSITAVDPDSSTWTYTLSGNANLSFAAGSSVTTITGAAPDVFANTSLATGNYTATLGATDGDGNTYSENVKVSVGTNGFAEVINGSADSDWIFGRQGIDVLNGNAGDDVLSGGAGSDALSGGAGRDALYGGASADSLTGGAGNDTLFGGNGSDTLNGGAGVDQLSGGANADVFILSSKGAANADAILDFDGRDGFFDFNQDVIQLKGLVSSVLSDGSLAGANFKSYSGTGTFDSNDYVQFDTASGKLYIDLDGNGTTHTAEQIATVTLEFGTLGASDFTIVS